MARIPPPLALLAALLLVPATHAADAPAWAAQVPDFRSEWPPPLAIGTEAPAFSRTDARTGRPVSLAKARKGTRATLLLFLDENCGTCKHRAKDLGADGNGFVLTSLGKDGERGGGGADADVTVRGP